MRRDPEKDCTMCLASGCDCECATCIAAREANQRMTPGQRLAAGLAAAARPGVVRLAEYLPIERIDGTDEVVAIGRKPHPLAEKESQTP